VEAGIWKLSGSRKGTEKGTCRLCLGEEDSKHILLECPEKEKKRNVVKQWLDTNEEVVYRIMLSCTNKVILKNMGVFLYRVQCKWERKVKEIGI
jgi:hypothetical protein